MMLWASNAAGSAILLNSSWRAYRGLSVHESVEDGWWHGVHRADRRGARAAYGKAHETQRPLSERYRVRRADGSFRWVRDGAAPWFDDAGLFVGFIGCCVELEDEPRSIETELPPVDIAQLVNASQDLVYRIRLVPSPLVDVIAGNVRGITGRTPREHYADSETVLRALRPALAAFLDGSSSTRERRLPGMFTHAWEHPDGRVVWTEDRCRPVRSARGRVVAIEGVARDVTQRLDAERALTQSEEQLRQLTGRIETAREEERRVIARELHDDVGQTLTALKIEINRTVAAFGSEQDDVTAINRLQSIVSLVDLGIAAVKRLSAQLRPATLDHFGLAEAIRWEALTFKARTGIRCQVTCNRRHTKLSTEQQTTLFRIAQEALDNVVCHAHASSARITLTESDEMVEFRIRDNGRGISSAEAAAPGSLGLRGMRERAALVGGTFTIAGRRGSGTTVTVVLPLMQPTAARRTRLRRSSR